ncbi:LCP family protein [Blastococcus brunescens]|uniref:LCP family protein n=1 Tax=Blastococcus brunescens TaxID=1564165 RepID=A0ABZ1B8N8_9ACTN|nr:LCP family protein [Blastococcus sp. BMG 8361]WRL67170.1 LCP family protein [Blastococcus sp. BMG 8361]
MASSARVRVASRRVMASSARSTMPSTRSRTPDTRLSSSSMRPTAAATGDQVERVREAVADTPAAFRRSDGPGTEGSLTGTTLRRKPVAHYSVGRFLARSGVSPAASPARSSPTPRIVGARRDDAGDGAGTTTRRCRHRWGTADAGRCWFRRPRTHPPRCGRRPGRRPVRDRRAAARPSGRRRRSAPCRPPGRGPPSLRAPDEPPPVVRAGLPPVPGGGVSARQSGLPPVPGAGRPAPQAGLPPVPRSRPAGRLGARQPPLPPERPHSTAPRHGRAPAGRPATASRPASGGRSRSAPADPRPDRARRGGGRGAALPPGALLLRRPEDRPGRCARGRRAGDPRARAAGRGRDLPGRRQRRARPDRDGLGRRSAGFGLGRGDRAVLVSFPPTALVDTPACRTPDGSLRSPVTEAFATALLEGGPGCMVRAVQQLSGLRVDHYLGVDLADLPGMVDALGGVPVCVIPSQATDAAATRCRRACPRSRGGGRRLPPAGGHRYGRDRNRGGRAGPATAHVHAPGGDVDRHVGGPDHAEPLPQPRRRGAHGRRADQPRRPPDAGRQPG